MSTSHDNGSQAFPVIHHSSSSVCYTCEHKWKVKVLHTCVLWDILWNVLTFWAIDEYCTLCITPSWLSPSPQLSSPLSSPCSSQDLRLERENLQAKVDLLSSIANKNNFPGPVYDCVVFHDGTSWRWVPDPLESKLLVCTMVTCLDLHEQLLNCEYCFKLWGCGCSWYSVHMHLRILNKLKHIHPKSAQTRKEKWN